LVLLFEMTIFTKKMMHQKDKLKAWIAFCMIVVVFITYYFEGKDALSTKIVSGASLICWIIVMVVLNKKK